MKHGEIFQFLNGMAHCMSEIKQCPFPFFSRIRLHHLTLDFAALLHHMNKLRETALQDLFSVTEHPVKIRGAADQPMLQDFPHTAGELFRRQCFQNRKIHINQRGLMESPHHIFILFKIHPCFSANAAVHLCQQRGGNLDKTDAPQIRGCRIAGHVACNAAAQSHQDILPVQAVLYQMFIDFLNLAEIFMSFSCRYHADRYVPAVRPQQFFHLSAIKGHYVAVGYQAEPPFLYVQLCHPLRQIFKRFFQPDRIGRLIACFYRQTYFAGSIYGIFRPHRFHLMFNNIFQGSHNGVPFS